MAPMWSPCALALTPLQCNWEHSLPDTIHSGTVARMMPHVCLSYIMLMYGMAPASAVAG